LSCVFTAVIPGTRPPSGRDAIALHAAVAASSAMQTEARELQYVHKPCQARPNRKSTSNKSCEAPNSSQLEYTPTHTKARIDWSLRSSRALDHNQL
jgi:hypothetical protein